MKTFTEYFENQHQEDEEVKRLAQEIFDYLVQTADEIDIRRLRDDLRDSVSEIERRRRDDIVAIIKDIAKEQGVPVKGAMRGDEPTFPSPV